MERLIIAVKKVERPVLGEAHKMAAKGRILQNIKMGRSVGFVPYGLRGIRDKVRAIGSGVILPAALVCRLKERIMDAVENSPSMFKVSPYARYFRAVMSGVLLFVFTVTALFSAPFRIPVTYASTYLDDIDGDVMVLRDGRTIEARKDLSIVEGDTILTLGQSTVTVHFLDDSISRLGENTGLEIRKLYSDPANPIVTRVKLFLREGRIWTKVVNLIDESSSFEVKTEKASADVPKKGAFDMLSRDDFTKVAVFDNMVDLMPANAPEDTPVKTVMAGYQAEISGDISGNIDVRPIAADDPEIKASTKWLAANMAKDEDYGQALTDTAENAASADAVVDVSEKNVAMSNPEIDLEKSYFLAHYNDLVKAEAMFVRGNHKEGSILLRSFRRGVNNTLQKLPALQASDPLNTGLLKNLMQEKIAVQLKDMSGFLPGDKLYPVKEALMDVELLLAEGDINKMQLRISQAEGTLLDMQQLLNEDKLDYAAALLNDYSERTAQLVIKMDSANAAELEVKLSGLIMQQVQQFKVLTAIEQSLTDEGQADFRLKIASLRRESLLKLLDTLAQLKGSVPPEILIELKDIFDTYLADEDDRDLMAPVFEKMLGADGGLNFISPDSSKMPAEIGAVMIVNMEATPDVQGTGVNPGTAGPVMPSLNSGDGQ